MNKEIRGIVRAVCISKQRGTAKEEVPECRLIEDWGLESDAHAGNWHRQVSLLALEQIEAFRKRGADVAFGAFGENLVVEGFDLSALPVGTVLTCGDAELELTQIGKECHSRCAIYAQVGDCIMPREGVFAVVKKGGLVKPGNEIRVQACGASDKNCGQSSEKTGETDCQDSENADETGCLGVDRPDEGREKSEC